MKSLFKPDRRASSVYEIDFDREYEDGIRGLIFDIDNTLVPQNAPADSRSISFAHSLMEKGFSISLISNNSRKRVEAFADSLGVNHIPNASKPSRRAYRKAMALMGTTPENTLFIGDQIFTDIFGARRAHIKNILVDPLEPSLENPFIRMKRKFEGLVAGRRGSTSKTT
ncbi:MAG: YqeG family HAD IIIA-type phosphatase [Lachnospiraceae bacterium]|nr:YqeG family HAD IIIA-type phosphatase [Lachnospiraceae bacterium]